MQEAQEAATKRRVRTLTKTICTSEKEAGEQLPRTKGLPGGMPGVPTDGAGNW